MMGMKLRVIAGYVIRIFALSGILLTSWLRAETSIEQQNTYFTWGITVLGLGLALFSVINWASSNLRYHNRMESQAFYIIVVDLVAHFFGIGLVIGKVYNLEEFRSMVFIHIMCTIVVTLLIRLEYISQRKNVIEAN